MTTTWFRSAGRALVGAAIFMTLAAPAVADDAADAKTFMEAVYSRYADGSVTSPNWQMEIYDSPMLALMAEDLRLSPEGSYVLDWDPICQCQDFARLRATVRVKLNSPATGVATVDFRDDGMSDARDSHATFDLVKERGGWRIHDIHSKDFENPAHSMRARFIEANAERHRGH